MNWNIVISVFAFTILFLSALFLFLRDYPSDRRFSVTFILAGGVLLWRALACGAGVCPAPKTETDTDNKIECFIPKNDNLEASNEHHENGSNAGQEPEYGDGNGICERKNDDRDTN